jgi:hypothetical protein
VNLHTLKTASNWLCVHRRTTPPAVLSRTRRMLRLCGVLPCIVGVNPLTRGSQQP